jgi:type IV pilus assembly protein PilP
MITLRVPMALLLLSALLAGCSDSDVREVKDWMETTKKNTKVNVAPLSEPKTFVPFAYTALEESDPYDPNKLLGELARAAAKSDNKFRPDLERRKELLETYPLDTIKMVGIMQKGGINYALLQIDRAVHQVKAGQRLGQNFGVVTSVTEQAININERVQDASGEWVERMSKLELQESKENNK